MQTIDGMVTKYRERALMVFNKYVQIYYMEHPIQDHLIMIWSSTHETEITIGSIKRLCHSFRVQFYCTFLIENRLISNEITPNFRKFLRRFMLCFRSHNLSNRTKFTIY